MTSIGQGAVAIPYPIEDHRPGGGHIEVIVHGLNKSNLQAGIWISLGGAGKFGQSAHALVDARQGGPGAG